MMAYPNYPYPGYPPYYPPQVPDQLAQLRQQQMQQPIMQPVPPQPPQADSGGIIWVQGEAGAKAFHVAPGNTVQLWDSEDTVIYLKSADMAGMPSMRVLEYTERNAVRPAPQQQQTPQIDPNTIVTWDKLDEYLAERLKRPAKAAKPKEETENG